MAFGLLSGKPLLLAVISAIVLIALFMYLKKHPMTRWEGIGLGLLIGGAIGNLIDRLAYGYVIDMLEPLFMRLFIFNVADAGITIGAAMLLFLPLFGQAAEGVVREVSLLALTGVSPWLKAVFIALVTATALLGVAALALQSVSHSLWTRCRTGLSLLLSSAGVLLFILTRQPYAAVLLFAFLAAKAWMLLKER